MQLAGKPDSSFALDCLNQTAFRSDSMLRNVHPAVLLAVSGQSPAGHTLISTIMLQSTASQIASRALRSGLVSSGRCFTSVSLPDLPYDYGALEPHIPAGRSFTGCCIEQLCKIVH